MTSRYSRRQAEPPGPPRAFPAPLARQIARAALAEDLGPGDVTTRALISPGRDARAYIVARQPGVLAGVPMVSSVFAVLSAKVRLRARLPEGAAVSPGRRIAELRGPLRALLEGERTALNFLCRLSGIATLTRRFVRAAAPHKVTILDTRKTTPLLRRLEKYAVTTGGGRNHRFGLYDAVLIKDNHIEALGSLRAAVLKVRERLGATGTLEVEAQNLAQVREALGSGADIIMLDNMRYPEMRKAIRLIGPRARVEISGGINLANVKRYSGLRPDFISVGALTHSAPILDFSLDILPG